MQEKWIKRYMDLARFVSYWSEDPSKKVGSVIVRNNRVVSVGYNGLPNGVKFSDERMINPLKLELMEHAERNCIYTASKMGHSTEGCQMFSTFFPCTDCSRAIIQSGITTLFTEKIDPTSKWYEKMMLSKMMLEEANIKVIEL